MKILSHLIIIISLIICITNGLPSQIPTTDNPNQFNYASIQSQIIATSLLKDNNNLINNQIYSPLGISTILSVLAEGSRSETYQEFQSAFGYPESKLQLRNSFEKILKNYQQKQIDFGTDTVPTFKTWFYIYRNNTIRPEYRDILSKFYSIEVKDIDEIEFNWNQPNTSIQQSDSFDEKFSIIPESNTPVNSKDILEFEDLKKSEPFDDGRSDVFHPKLTSKFDHNIEDKEYVEKPIILLEINNKETASSDQINEIDLNAIINTENNPINDVNDSENETIQDDEKLEVIRENIQTKNEFKKDFQLLDILNSKFQTNEPQRINIPIDNFDKSRHFKMSDAGRTLVQKDDIASALSANSINGRAKPSKTKMLLFNGLYYRGNWAYPFQKLRKSNMKEIFYVTPMDTIQVNIMRTRGTFRTAQLESLNSQAIEFPYENRKYSFVVIIPNEIDGLGKLIDTIQPVDIQQLDGQLKNTEIAISLPKFEVEQTSRSEQTLKKLGLNRIFSRFSADLGDLSEDRDLHVEEIVQHVNLRVDEGAATKNSLTASNPSSNLNNSTASRSSSSDQSSILQDTDEKSIIVNRPFLYFVLDKNCHNFVIAVGKILSPEIKEEFGLADD